MTMLDAQGKIKPLVERLRQACQEGREIIEPWDHDPYLYDEAADEIERLRAALTQAVAFADVTSMEDGMPEGKQATRLTATWLGKDIRYSAEFDVKTARSLLGSPSQQLNAPKER